MEDSFKFYNVTITKDELRKAFKSEDSLALFIDYLSDIYKERVKREVLLKALESGLIYGEVQDNDIRDNK